MDKEKNRLPFFRGGSTSDFIEFYDRLTAVIHAKGRRWRQALYGKGSFKGYNFAQLVLDEDDDDFDDLRQCDLDAVDLESIKAEADDVNDDDSMPLLEVTRESAKDTGIPADKEQKHSKLGKPARVPKKEPDDDHHTDEAHLTGGMGGVDARERKIRSIYCSICRKMFSLILQCIAAEPHRQIRNYGCVPGDGPNAHRLLRKIYQGTGSVALIRMIKSLVTLKMEGKHRDLNSYSSEFRRCAVSISTLGYKLDENILKALYLIGLSSAYESVISTIANSGFENVLFDDLKESIRSQKDLLKIREKSPLPALGIPTDKSDSKTSDRKFKCYNCRQVHEGGERMCKAPCRLCGSKNHTRYGCPKREKKKNGTDKAQLAIPSAHLIIKDKNSLLCSLPSNINEDGPNKQLPFLDSGAGGIYAAVKRVSKAGKGWDLVFPEHLVGGRVLNPKPATGSVTTASSAQLPYNVSCDLWGLKNVKLVEGLNSHLIGTHPLIHNQGMHKNYVVLGPTHAHLVPVQDLVLPSSAKRIGTADGTMFRFDVEGEFAMLSDHRPSNILELLHQRTHWPLKVILDRDGH